MKKTILIFLIGLLGIFNRVSGQNSSQHNSTLVGTVVDSATNQPLHGATIKIKSSGLVTSTDAKGTFSLVATELHGSLVISYVGYKTRQIDFDQTVKGPLYITLIQDASQLREINVLSTGYQDIPRERATGSFAQPLKQMYDDRVSTDVLSKLNGITSGLVFNANTTQARSGF